MLPDKLHQEVNLELGYPKNYFSFKTFGNTRGSEYVVRDFYDAGQLDDVIAKPSEYDKKLFSITKKMFPNKQVRDLVCEELVYADDVSDYPQNSYNDRLLNMILLYKLCGSPSITNKSKSKFNIICSNYVPYYNHINAYPGQLISELSHAFQYNNPIRKPSIPLDNKTDNGSDYDRKGSIEHQAHEIIAPNLVEFLETGDRKYLKKAIIDANKEYDKYGHWWWNKGKD